MKQARFAVRDIMRNLTAVLLFIGMLTFAVYYLVIYVNEVMLYWDVLTKIERIQDYNIVDFNVIHPPELLIKPEVTRLLDRTLSAESTQSYAVIEQLNLSSQLDELGIPVFYGFGQFSQVFNLEPKGLVDSDTPFTVIIGTKVRTLDIGDVVTIGDQFSKTIDVPVAGRLPRNACFLRRKGSTFIEYLDNSIVVLTSLAHWQEYHVNDAGSLLQDIHFINAPEDDVLAFVKAVEEGSTFQIRPNNFNEYVREKALSFRDGAMSQFVFNFITFTVVGVAMISNFLMLLDRNLREYAIHRVYGATHWDLYLRTLIYISLIILPSFAVGYWRLLTTPYTLVPTQSRLVILIMAVVAIGLAGIYPLIKLRKQDVAADLRRE